VVTQKLLAKQLAAINKHKDETTVKLDTLIEQYRESPEFEGLKDSTKKDYRLWLDRISEHFGKLPLELFENKHMRGKVHAWRNQWKDQPRTADKGVVMLSTILNWGIEHAMVSINVADKVRKLHKVDKSAQIWEERHWRAIEEANVPKHVMDAIVLASHTGLRLSDLVVVSWEQVFPDAIRIDKTTKRDARAVIPILPELREWMERRERTGTILKNSRGHSWSKHGLSCVLRKAFPESFDRTLHDLRGTFATRLIKAGLTDEQTGMVMGWSAKQVAQVRARYVDEATVIDFLSQKIRRETEHRETPPDQKEA
jgi:integrase